MNNISIVIPVYNEEKNILPLIKEIFDNLNTLINFEIIVVDDCSIDNTYKTLIESNYFEKIKIIKNIKNLGQSGALKEGIKNSIYENIVTLDGDGQNPPKDIIKITKVYFEGNFSLVGGLRLKRKDNIIKIISSKIANYIRSLILKDNCKDTGCSLKIFRKDIFLSLEFFNGIHRFLPALFKAHNKKTYFISVDHRSRLNGNSNYGTFDRLFQGIKDLIKVFIMINRIKKDV